MSTTSKIEWTRGDDGTAGATWNPTEAPWMSAVLPNVWLGVSAETQRWAQVRLPLLAGTPAAVRFASCEPLLGALDIRQWLDSGLDWVIAGGESGPGARPMHPDWARSLRDQCRAAGVAFFFKQWGAWAPNGARGLGDNERERCVGEPDELGGREVIVQDAPLLARESYQHTPPVPPYGQTIPDPG